MASLGHIAVGVAAAEIATWLSLAERRPSARPLVSWRAVLGWSALALSPDADIVGFVLGVPYGDAWGHRGATHSLALAVLVGVLSLFIAPTVRMRRVPLMLLTMCVLASHGLLDTLTDGGLGVALGWPWSTERLFAAWRPIPVAPIGAALFSRRGLYCGVVELVQFFPMWGGALIAGWWRRRGR